MRKWGSVALVFLVFLLFAAGCATLADARTAKGSGTSRIYNASFDTVWETIPKAVHALGPKIVGENKQEGYILAEKEITAFSYGEKIAIFVDKIDDSRTKVEVVSKKAMATNILAWNWEKPILDKLSEMLPNG